MCRNPNDEIPNEEKNQYTELVIEWKQDVYIQKRCKEMDRENI